MKLLVTGDRCFDDWQLLKRKLDAHTLALEDVEVVLLGRKKCGVEELAQKWACKWCYRYWDYHCERKFDEKAHDQDPVREAFEFARAAVVFSSGDELETDKLIDLAKRHKLQLRIVRY